MSPGLLPYTVETVPDLEGLTSRAGLPLVLETMRALGLPRVIREQVHIRERQSGYTETEKIEALVVLLAAGGDCLDAIAVLQADGGLGRLLERQLPSADTLRHFLYACHDDQLIAAGPGPAAGWPGGLHPGRERRPPGTGPRQHRPGASGGRPGEEHHRDPGPRRHHPGEPQAGRPPALQRRAGLPAHGGRTGASRISWWRTSTGTGTWARGWRPCPSSSGPSPACRRG